MSLNLAEAKMSLLAGYLELWCTERSSDLRRLTNCNLGEVLSYEPQCWPQSTKTMFRQDRAMGVEGEVGTVRAPGLLTSSRTTSPVITMCCSRTWALTLRTTRPGL